VLTWSGTEETGVIKSGILARGLAKVREKLLISIDHHRDREVSLFYKKIWSFLFFSFVLSTDTIFL
jgi:hypothetical protein